MRPVHTVDVDVAVAHADLTRAGYEPRPGDGAAPRRVAVAIHCRRLRYTVAIGSVGAQRSVAG